jgi:membrane associated rhomboid family serine protease
MKEHKVGTVVALSDASRQPRRFAVVTAAIIAVNVLVFLLEVMGGAAFVETWSMVPADIMAGRHWITLLTAMFVHAGWMRILGNTVFLRAFGPELEDAMGRPRYLVFYLRSGCAAWMTQILISPGSSIPNLGASGAIAGVYPRDAAQNCPNPA